MFLPVRLLIAGDDLEIGEGKSIRNAITTALGGPDTRTLTRVLRIGLLAPPASCSRTATFVTGLGDIPDLLEDLDAEALVVGVVAGEVAVVLALGVGAGAAKDELFPVAHCHLLWGRGVTVRRRWELLESVS